MHGLCGMLISKTVDAHSPVQAHSFVRICDQGMTASQPSFPDYNRPRLRKSPRLSPEERSTKSMVNLRRQTSHASSTPWMIALSGSFLFSTCRLVRLITVSIESVSVCSFRSVLRNLKP